LNSSDSIFWILALESANPQSFGQDSGQFGRAYYDALDCDPDGDLDWGCEWQNLSTGLDVWIRMGDE
jgi:hypothetical protein